MKFKHITAIKNEITKIIDNSQEIKRYCTYLSDSPLSQKGKLENGTFIQQPNINKSLINENIMPYSFSLELISEHKSMIFIYNAYGDLRGKVIGDNVLAIDILCTAQQNILSGIGEERITSIADIITDLIDSERANKSLTNIVVGKYQFDRLWKDNHYIVLTLLCDFSTSNMRR